MIVPILFYIFCHDFKTIVSEVFRNIQVILLVPSIQTFDFQYSNAHQVRSRESIFSVYSKEEPTLNLGVIQSGPLMMQNSREGFLTQTSQLLFLVGKIPHWCFSFDPIPPLWVIQLIHLIPIHDSQGLLVLLHLVACQTTQQSLECQNGYSCFCSLPPTYPVPPTYQVPKRHSQD